MYLVDTHCHLTDIPASERKVTVERANKANVKKIITVACRLNQVADCLALSDQYLNVFATAGIHPTELTDNIERDLERVYEYAKREPKIVAIGEIGIDYYHDKFPHHIQKAFLVGQLNIARQLKKPAILHCRGGKNPGEGEKAYMEIIDLLEKEEFGNGVLHCFSGNKVEAEKLLDMGLMLSFTGIITYPANAELREIIKSMPLDRLMLETDAPYIVPNSRRGQKGEPADIVEIANKVAEIKGVPMEEVMRITTENAERFFGI